MDFNIEVRRKQLESLDQFISSSKDRVDSILDFLGWTSQKVVEKQRGMEKCPINPTHKYLSGDHVEKCTLRKEGYRIDEQFLSEPNPIPGGTVLLDDVTKINVLNDALSKKPLMKTGWRSHDPVARTADRLNCAYTPDERLALYDYTVSVTEGPPQVPEFNLTQPVRNEKKDLSMMELKALERDNRRRRIKYKARCVHTNSKSTTEVLREVIASQMEALEDLCRGDSQSDVSLDVPSPRSEETPNGEQQQKIRSPSREPRTSTGRNSRSSRERYSSRGSRERHNSRSSRERNNSRNSRERHNSRNSRERYSSRSSRERYHSRSSRERHNSRERSHSRKPDDRHRDYKYARSSQYADRRYSQHRRSRDD